MSLAVVIHAERDLRVEEYATPPVGPGEVEVKIGAGGICGSDLHYYLHGGFGVVRLKEPMVLGHEIAGTVAAVGEGVTSLAVGDKVAVNPSRPCGKCEYCLEGKQHHCLDMRFYGSAMRFPHVNGGFRQRLVVEAAQCHVVPAEMPLGHAAIAEPLSVTLHAVRRAGDLLGKRVLVTGSGPIGVLAVAAARLAGAQEIVATDIADEPLAVAREMGAHQAVNTLAQPEALGRYEANKGYFDVLIEASGNPAALRSALAVLRPGSVAVLVGLGGEATLMLNTVVGKEIDLRGSFRFNAEFPNAVRYLAERRIDPTPMISQTVPIREAKAGFDLASDRKRAMKVQLAFD